ncbi:MAG: prepilin-type N-terminal cleavage/methylation domain-containing protein [Candidatus Omnitrophota bacterium]
MKKRILRYIDKRPSGFTLVEILMVVSMLAVVSLAIYSTFNNGMKIWQRVNRSLPEEDIGIFFDKMNGDLKNTLHFANLEFTGDKKRLEFVTLVTSRRFNNTTVGKVVYFYDRSEKTLQREEKDFAHIYNEEEGAIKQALKNIKGVNFQYYFYDKDKNEKGWLAVWDREDIPGAVRIELEVETDKGSNIFSRTISIPVAG